MTWSNVKTIWQHLHQNKFFWAAVALTIGYQIGQYQRVPTRVETHVVESQTSKMKLEESVKVEQQLRTELAAAQQTISELKVNSTEKVRIVYMKDGTTIVDKTKTTSIDSSTSSTGTVNQSTNNSTNVASTAVTNTENSVQKDFKQTTISMPKDRFYLGTTAKIDLTGLGTPGVEFKYRLLDLGKASIWTGAEAILQPTKLDESQFRIAVGVSF